MAFQMVAGESVIKEASANYQKGMETVGGKLLLTTHRLFFESHKLNIQKGGLGIDLREIAAVSTAWTKFLGLIPLAPNSMTVRTNKGVIQSFVVGGRGSWIVAIDAQRRAARG